MRIASFTVDGRESYGIVSGDGIIDAKPHLGGEYRSVAGLLEAVALDRLFEIAAVAPDYTLDDVQLLPPVTGRNPVLCVGRNYREVSEQAGYGAAPYPSIFQRRNAAQVGHGAPIIKPRESDQFDCEAELAVVIGRGGRRIPEDRALEFIAGYTILNEASVVDWMNHTSRNVTPGKNFDGSGALGPWMVTADEIADPQDLAITHRLNGEEIQHGSTGEMIYPVAQVIAYLSTFTQLIPGDVIATGTPGGIHARRQSRTFLKAGDVVEMEIGGIGRLRNEVVEG